MPLRRFELSEGSSNKFWSIEHKGSSVTVTFGRIGTEGQTKAAASDATGDIPFASSNGGPVVAVPEEVAAHWLGLGDDDFHAEYLARSSKTRSTEYGGFSTMKLAGSTVLIFGGEIHTSWLKEPGGGTFVREGCPHTAAQARKLVSSVPEKAWKRFTMLALKKGRLVVLDSALPAGDLSTIDTSNGVVRAKLEPGTYQVDIAALGGIDLARLRRTAAAVAKPKRKR